ncbi:kinesin-like protein KIF2A isoform X2 [Dermacentor andersoni]|uniref:kinesin-like protein KIF2A isoform X2 n=1 Tax=Dermacentor andersoni TaxID=34620 RepID=UPI0024170BF2|nr:kinesin-like protein KIF2A isoform X2 [Dermacentor andersoni]
MAAQVGGLRIGCSVDIERSDGRIHSATVVSIDKNKQCILVQWEEHGETMRKELQFSIVFELNPELRNVNPSFVKKLPRRAQVPVMSANFGPNHDRCSLAGPSMPRQSLHDSALRPPPTPVTPVKLRSASSSSAKDVLMNSVATRPSHEQQAPRALVAPRGSVPNLSAANHRRSTAVTKLESTRKQREEHRARQLSPVEEKRERRNVDTGNPNRQFLSMIREYRSTLDIKPLCMSDQSEVHRICVAVRKRPLNRKELQRKEVDVITVPNGDRVVVHEPKLKVDLTKFLENSAFRFDYAFDETASNELVYKYTARPLVKTIFKGGMATCFAYGQTGSGKTHTMGGDFSEKVQDCSKGIYALATKDVFMMLKSPQYRNEGLVVSSSFFEIYSGKVFDLLNAKKKLRVLEDGKQQVQVVGLVEREVDSLDEVMELIQQGSSVRTSGQTSANQNSSRSHAVFQINLRRSSGRLHGKFSLIDLAGNERGADTSNANRQTRTETAEINKSLLALKECIRALGRRGAHLPFRASKLTQVLKDSFIGENSRTCMIAMISPSLSSCEHSLNTLRYADRVKELGVVDRLELEPPSDQDVEMAPGSQEEGNLILSTAYDDVQVGDSMRKFHEAHSHLQAMEEEILDLHKTVVEASEAWMNQDMDLLTMTAEVDYDLDLYAQKLKDLLAAKMEVFSKFNGKLTAFQQQLAEEERISMNIKRPLKGSTRAQRSTNVICSLPASPTNICEDQCDSQTCMYFD